MLTKSGVAPYCLKTGSSAVRDTCASFSLLGEGTFRNGVSCDNETFGDPVQGSVKSCQVFE